MLGRRTLQSQARQADQGCQIARIDFQQALELLASLSRVSQAVMGDGAKPHCVLAIVAINALDVLQFFEDGQILALPEPSRGQSVHDPFGIGPQLARPAQLLLGVLETLAITVV